ncbi:MAG: hypothetical protein M3437_14215 [Chloroflexota bacterium]|nr:hypothetical protein [Chloroflexota bacterium]MDQ5866498.1 hypothetical protein [Chloroflexota bacterium]
MAERQLAKKGAQYSSDSVVSDYDRLEREMLYEFFKYAGEHKGDYWLHWNMVNVQFGFQALAHRYQVLGGAEVDTDIPEDKRFNLPHALKLIYGEKYAPHRRLENLVTMNGLHAPEFLNGEAEARAFEDKKYVELHYSTLRKVEIIAEIAERAHSGKLKTNADWRDIHGGYGEAFGELLRDHWLAVVILYAATLVPALLGLWGALFQPVR